MTVFAQEKLGNIGGEGLGPFGNIGQEVARNDPAGGALGLTAVTKAVSSVIGVMTVAAAIWFIFQFMTGGFYWITSAGDKGKLNEARDRIQNAFIGLIVVVAGWAVLALAGQFLGYDIVIQNPTEVIKQLNIKLNP